MIKGKTVTLYTQTATTTDAFGHPVYTETAVTVENVLISPSSTDDVTTSTDLCGKKAIYTLAIPKGDTNDWENKKVRFNNKDWRTFGFTIEGIEDNIPGDWHKKVMVEKYE